MLQILNSSNGFLRGTNLLIIALLKFCYCYFPSKVNVCIKFSQFDTVMQERFISCLFFWRVLYSFLLVWVLGRRFQLSPILDVCHDSRMAHDEELFWSLIPNTSALYLRMVVYDSDWILMVALLLKYILGLLAFLTKMKFE